MNARRTLKVRGGTLAYAVSGDGPPVVLIQGVSVHGSGWEPQVTELQRRYRCLTFDNRGIGLSQPTSLPLSIGLMAEDTLALMDAEGWESAHIVGHSLGGLIGLHLALTARERVRSLSLLCTFADGAIPQRLSWRMLWLGLRSRIGTRAGRRNAFLEITMPRAFLAKANRVELARSVGTLFGHDLADQPPVVMKQLAAMRVYDATPRLGELSGLPTLVISGPDDIIAPAWAGKKLAAGIDGARFIEIPGAAHGLTIQCPAQVNALLIEHFETAGRSGSAK